MQKNWKILILTVTVLSLLLCGCGETKPEATEPLTTAKGDGSDLESAVATHYVTIEIENYGTIKAELYGEAAPISVDNFVRLAESGFYNGLTFHRIISGFMMQGGAPNSQSPKVTPIKGEFTSNGVENNLKHERGVLSMARTSEPDSATSQFFIMHEVSPHLDGNYAAFGKVIEGMDVVDAICTSAVPTDNNGSIAAANQPVIKSIVVTHNDNIGTTSGDHKKPTESEITEPEPTLPEPTVDDISHGDGATLETAVATHYVTIEIADYGTIKAELYGNTAPITVENFVSLAESGFYDGLTFHRIISGFMMQGGAGNSQSPALTPIKGEFAVNGIENNLKHERGVLSMARTYVADSATSQFFIMHEVSPHLDGQYAAFGKVIEGIEVVDAICAAVKPTDGNGSIAAADQPVIQSITVEIVPEAPITE